TSTPLPSPLPTPASDSEPLKIVPKGLRSFDAHDADFFLELLPGPRDRGGLPDSIRFWKSRIEETDADNTFSVGLIYGPSGCGKSSLVKAGLLPLLSDDIIPIYIEATAEDTESRLLGGLRKHVPTLDPNLSLKEPLAACGRAFGKLPEKPGDITREQRDFLSQAAQGLASEGKVISVRLALFAEMMKGRAWTVANLKEAGGTAGIGVTFLEETFCAST